MAEEGMSLGSDQELILVSSESDALGFVHHKYQICRHNIPVEGSVFIVHSQQGLIKHANDLCCKLAG